MASVVESAFIAYPVEVVFRTAADPQEQLRWDRDSLRRVERLSSVPLGPGARYRGDFKGVGWVEFEFLEFDPPRSYTHRTKLPLGEMRHVFTFESEAGGTRMRQEVKLSLAPLARLAAPLYAWFIRRRVRHLAQAVRRDLDAGLGPDAARQGDAS